MSNNNSIDTILNQIRSVYRECPFLQLDLLPTDRFLGYLRDRDLYFTEKELQEFRTTLPPIETSEESQGCLYHPYQVWLAYKLVQSVSPNLIWSSWWTANPDDLNRFIAKHRQWSRDNLEQLAEGTPGFHKLLALLVTADPYCMPRIRGKLSLHLTMSGEDNYAEYLRWRNSFDAKAVMTTSNMGVDEIKEWHRLLSVNAEMVNDAEAWYLLMRHASFEKRNKLKGRVRLAFDLYEMAECLRIVLKLAGENVVAEDDYFGSGGDWKTRFYAVKEIDFAKRIVLKRIAREYGLDGSYRGFWFVEGPTELGFIQAFSEGSGINIEERGIALSNLGGTGDLTKRRIELAKRLRGAQSFIQQLQKLKSDEVFAFITVDDDQHVSEGLQSLREQGLLTAGFVKWEVHFEEANFTVTELIQVIKEMTKPCDVEFYPSEIETERKKKNSSGCCKTLGEAMEAVARKKVGVEQFGKSETWGRALAAYALEYPNLGNELRPIIKAFRKALSMSYAHFRGTMTNLECSASGELVNRTKKK